MPILGSIEDNPPSMNSCNMRQKYFKKSTKNRKILFLFFFLVFISLIVFIGTIGVERNNIVFFLKILKKT